jgi:hypothetical protein
MKLNFRRTPPGDTLWEFRTTKTDDIRTLYFAMRAYRDQLQKSLFAASWNELSEDDYRDDDTTPRAWNIAETEDRTRSWAIPEVYPWVLLDSTDFEDHMFLHEQLMKVNEFLFEIVQNHRSEQLQDIRQELDVL